jgi:hypothetical protein
VSSEGGPPPGAQGPDAMPGEDEAMRQQRAAYEAELSRIAVPDMLMQAAVTLLNLAAHRLAPEQPGGAGAGPGSAAGAAAGGGRDLDQARDAIDAVRGLLDILERRMPGELRPLRDALSQLQLAYASEVGGAGTGAVGEAPDAQGGEAGSGDPGATGGAGGRGAGGTDTAPKGDGGGADGEGAGGEDQRGPGPAESSGRLWIPGR